MSVPTHTLDTHHFALLDRIVQRLSHRGELDEATRRAVTVLTAAADPARADRLAVRPGEPPVLVERLAVWAMRRVDDDAVAAAAAVLEDSAPSMPAADTAQAEAAPREVLVPCP